MKFETEKFDLSVDYSRRVQEMIDAGNYGWISKNITEENFPMLTDLNIKKMLISTKLFHFNHSINSGNAIFEMDKAGYRPATLAELLALGEFHPELQKKFPIVALGFVWRNVNNIPYVPILNFSGNKRELNLGWFGFDWPDNYRFFGFRK